MDPRNGAILALANWPRVDANDVAGRARLRAPGPRDRRHLRAGLDLQGVHRRRRAARTARSRPTPSSTSRRRSRSPTATIGEAARPRLRDALDRADPRRSPRNVGAIMIGRRWGQDRASTQWVRRFGFGKPTGVDLPGEERGHRAPAQEVLGLVDGQPADRPGHLGDADADGHRLRGDRQRRHPAPAAHRRSRSAASRPPSRAGHRVISAATAGSLRTMLEGVFGPGGTASGAAIPGYELAGKTGTAKKIDPITAATPKAKYVASFVGFAPARAPEAAGGGHGRRAPGRRSTAAWSPRPPSRRSSPSRCGYLKIPPG